MTTVLLVLFGVLAVSVVTWATYELTLVATTGRVRVFTFISLMGVGFVFLLVWGPMVGLDAFSCADNAELDMAATTGPAAGGLGDVKQWNFGNCSIYWYDQPRMWG